MMKGRVGDNLRVLIYAMQNRVERLEREIRDLPKPRDENDMTQLECFIYGQKTQKENEIEELTRWINSIHEGWRR